MYICVNLCLFVVPWRMGVKDMKKKILIVDDEADIRITLTDILTNEGYEVSEAADGEEAVQKAGKIKPDLVLVDTILPGMDGIEVCRQIKKVKKLAAKVIVYTGKLDAIDAVTARYMGADDYCIKGNDLSYLIKAVKTCLKGKKNEK